MTFWPLTNSDFPTDQTFHQFHDLYTELDLHRIMSGFHGAFATGVASQQGTLTIPDTLFRSPILGLANAPIVETKFLELAMSLLDFSLRIPLGTFSILPWTRLWKKMKKFLPTAGFEPTTSGLLEWRPRLGVCHGWFHLYWLIWGVSHAKRARITKWKILAHGGIRTHYLWFTRVAP